MSVLGEKNAIKAAFVAVMTTTVTGTTSANVSMYVLPSPCEVWPQVVLSRPHYTATEWQAGAGAMKANDDNDPNIYEWEYLDQLVSQTGGTVEATMDTHDVFLEALINYFQSNANQGLPSGGPGTQQVEKAGGTITSDADRQGPYDLLAGSSAILSRGTITVYQRPRPAVA